MDASHTRFPHSPARSEPRVEWVDVAKGICILLVVMMHATLGVEKATGEVTALSGFIEWARPFRMPDFFLISGLFLAARIERPWREYIDTKVLHFAYFYLLWLHILLAVKAPSIVSDVGLSGALELYALSFVEPFSSLWFIYLLAVYFVVTKLLAGVPKAAVLASAALLHVFWRETGYFLADEFASRFIFFYAGYALAPRIFAFADRVTNWPALAVTAAILVWAALNAWAVTAGWASIHGPDLAFSFAGIAAVVATSVLLVRAGLAAPLTYCGMNSISIYLAFTLFMGPARQIVLRTADSLPGEAIALISMAAGVVGALVLARLVEGTRLAFLFTRPGATRLAALKTRLDAMMGVPSPAAEARFLRVARGR